MPDISLWPLSGARPGQGPIRRSGEFSNVRSGAFYSAIDTRRPWRSPAGYWASLHRSKNPNPTRRPIIARHARAAAGT